MKGLGRPKEFTGREEDFLQWSKKTEAFFAGVILVLADGHECGRRCAQPGVRAAASAHSTHASNLLEAWRRLQKRYDPATGRKETKPSAHDFFLGRCSPPELQAGIER